MYEDMKSRRVQTIELRGLPATNHAALTHGHDIKLQHPTNFVWAGFPRGQRTFQIPVSRSPMDVWFYPTAMDSCFHTTGPFSERNQIQSIKATVSY